SISMRMVRQQELAAAFPDHLERGLRDQLLDAGQGRPLHEQIVALILAPQSRKIRVVDEYPRSVRRIRSIFQIGLAAVQQQSLAVRVKEYRRESIVSIIFN